MTAVEKFHILYAPFSCPQFREDMKSMKGKKFTSLDETFTRTRIRLRELCSFLFIYLF